MKKNLDERSLSQAKIKVNFDSYDHFQDYMRYWGFQTVFYRGNNPNIPDNELGWYWIRKELVTDNYNYLTKDDLQQMIMSDLFQDRYNLPGNSNNGISIEAYNRFAKWDIWEGAYVDQLGFVSAPPASQYYGASLYLNSWVAQGGSGAPLSAQKFYKLKYDGHWVGGYVSGWGYVSKETSILGSSLSFLTVIGSEAQLGNISNLSREINRSINLTTLREYFKNCWDTAQNRYRIDDYAMRAFIDRYFYPSSSNDVISALSAHDGVILRIVTQTVIKDGKTLRYGDDYLIVDYNALHRQFIFVSPVYGGLGSIDAVPILENKIEFITFACKRSN